LEKVFDMDEAIPLEYLLPGQQGIVEEVVGSPDAIGRLGELGLRTGQPVEIVQAGSPCIVRVNGQKLCFREGEALGVLVRPRVSG
jgi:Fe2+ transport system protein FeoA